MAGSNGYPVGKRVPKKWLFLGSLGFVALMIGFVLPPTLNQAAADSKSNATSQDNAKDSFEYAPPACPDSPTPSAMFLRLGIGTVVVLVLCVATLWIGRRWISGTPAKTLQGDQLAIIDTLALGHRCSLFLVKAGNRQVLAGLDSTGLKALLPLTDGFETALKDAQDLPAEPDVANLQLPNKAAA
jgi:flagellar biogenesis protein FliO